MSAASGTTSPRETPRRPVRTAAITNLGCKVNQSEMEAAARRLRELGVSVVDANRPADLVLVNTCTVTTEADAKSRHAVRRARRTSPHAAIVVTGCSVQVGRDAFLSVDREARLVDNRSKDALLAEIDGLIGPASGAPPTSLPRPLPTLSGVDVVSEDGPAIEGIADGRASVERPRAFRTAARSSARTASFRPPAVPNEASPRRSCSRTSGERSAPGTARSC